LRSHLKVGLNWVLAEILQELLLTHDQHLKLAEESRAKVAALASTVTGMRDTIKCLMAPAKRSSRSAQRTADGAQVAQRQHPCRDGDASPAGSVGATPPPHGAERTVLFGNV
jgi:hypothetical protein